MARYVFVRHEGKEVLVKEAVIKEEEHLQEVIKCNPQLIPYEDLGLMDLMVVGRETTLVSGSIDLLCVDRSGQVVIVEFKKGLENSEHRRVIAQLLDYGAYLWGMEFTEFEQKAVNYFNGSRCDNALLKGCKGLQEAFEKTWGYNQEENADDGSEWTSFQEALASCLSKGSFLYLVISRNIDPVTRRTIEYLASQAVFKIAAIEIDHFEEGDSEIFVPRTILGTVNSRKATVAASSISKTSEADFLAKLEPDAREVFDTLLSALKGYDDDTIINWGTKGFSFRVNCKNKLVSILMGFPQEPTRIELYVTSKDPQVNEVLQKYSAKILEVFPKIHRATAWHTGNVPEIFNRDNIQRLIDIISETIAQLREI